MEKISIRPTLYIGLGGAGLKVLRKTKQRIVEQYGEVPPMIRFLGMDTDVQDLCGSENQVDLCENELCPIGVANPIDFVHKHPDAFSWLRDVQLLNCLSPEQMGDERQTPPPSTGQIRANGRVAFVYNVLPIKVAIEKAYGLVTSAAILDNDNFRRAEGRVQINIVFSLAGGTGSGIFIDVAYLIRKLFGKRVDLQGYAILPKVFRDMTPTGPAMDRVFPNAFGALQDLDYLMHLKPDDEPVTFNWISEEFSKEDFKRIQTPFDRVYLIDNVTNYDFTYDNIMYLADATSLALAASAELGSKADRLFDNVVMSMHEGRFDVENKKAWVSALGASSIVFRGEDVADFYAKKVMLRLIQLLNHNVKDACFLAWKWIDEVKIREDAGKDDVIDFLHEKRIRATLDIVDEKSPEVKVAQFCDSQLQSIREQVVRNAQELQERVITNLGFKVEDLLKSGEGCVSTTADFLRSVKIQLSVGLQEMQDERKWLEEQSAGLLMKRDIFLKDLEKESNKSWLSRSKQKIAEDKEDACYATEKYLLNELEIIRRTYAIELFNHLMQSIDGYANQTDKLKVSLLALSERLEQSISEKLGNRSKSSSLMEVDLAVEAIRSLTVLDHTIDMNEFFRGLGDRNLYELNDSELEAALLVFALSQNEYEQWKNKTVLEAVNELDEDAFRGVFRLAFEKAEPLLRIADKGYVTLTGSLLWQAVTQECLVCMNDTNDKRFLEWCHNSAYGSMSMEFATSSSKDRIVFIHQTYVFPAFAVSGIDDWRREYDISRVSCHFDENIHQRMIREHYDIMPADEDDPELETDIVQEDEN